MFLSAKDQQARRHVAALQGREHDFRLRERHHRVILAVQEYDGSREAIDEINGRAVAIKGTPRLVRLNKPVHVMQLELVRVGCKRGDVRDPIVAGTGRKYLVKGQRAQSCVSP